MDGIFIQKKINFWLILLLLCGIFSVFLYVFLNIVDPKVTSGSLIFLILGIFCGMSGISSLLWNRGAYLRIEENTIKAKYNLFGRLDCSINDIQFVLPQINTLTVLLKNGKRYIFMGLTNCWEICSFIRKQNYTPEKESPEILRQQLTQAQKARKKGFMWIAVGVGLMFAVIFLAVMLTEGKDMHEFTKTDRIYFTVMCVLELCLTVGLFVLADRVGKLLLPIEQFKYRIQGALLVSEPLPGGNVIAVYVDEDNRGRDILYGFPNDTGVYYQVQTFYGLQLVDHCTSEIFESIDAFDEDTFSPIEITEYTKKNC